MQNRGYLDFRYINMYLTTKYIMGIFENNLNR